MDFAKSFSFVFNDPDWIKKVLLIALVSLIPVVGMLVLYGWALQIAKKVIRKDSEPLLLPELDFGAQLSLGFKYFVLNLVYMIPVFLIMIPLMIVTAGGDAAGMDSTHSPQWLSYPAPAASLSSMFWQSHWRCPWRPVCSREGMIATASSCAAFLN